jgi:PAS domain S-box-containing protein
MYSPSDHERLAAEPGPLWGRQHDDVLHAFAPPGRAAMEPEFRVLLDELLLLRAAVETSPVCVSIASMTLPDQPLVFVNQAFTRLTGYDWTEALGRNARFLQGPGTEPAAREAMRTAIAAGRPVEVSLQNRRRDGSLFRNRLTLVPIRGPAGHLAAYVGHQVELP